MMRPIIRVGTRPGPLALAILLVGALRASAQERPAVPAAPAPAGAWPGYRPSAAWADRIAGRSAAGRPTTPTQAAAPVAPRGTPANLSPPRPGWAGYAPSSAWAGSRPSPGPPPARAARAGVYATRQGWAGYSPSSAWTGYRPGVAWRADPLAGARPLNMRQAHVSGPSPYADGVARNYYEYGTGRPVPLAKPWLPGSP